jgi:hypothetical protein
MKLKILSIVLYLTICGSCKTNSLSDTKPEKINLSCEEINSDTRRTLSETEIDHYSKNLPNEIKYKVEDEIKKKKYIDSIALIRNCLNIDLVSARDVSKKIEFYLNN